MPHGYGKSAFFPLFHISLVHTKPVTKQAWQIKIGNSRGLMEVVTL